MFIPNKGFTLIELLITIGVVAILVVVALPSMRDFVIDIRVASNVRLFLAANRFARSEAIKRGSRVEVCAAAGYNLSDLEWCRHGGAGFSVLTLGKEPRVRDWDDSYERDWSEGWIVYAGNVGNETEEILLRHGLKSNSMTTIIGSSSFMSYTDKGASSSYFRDRFNVLFSPGTKFARRVCISVTGLARVVRKTGAADPVC